MHKLTRIPLFLLLLLPLSPATGGEIFTWVDASGITHFSEQPPENAPGEVFRLELPPAPPFRPYPADDYYSVINQAARMETRRLQNEKLRAERLQAEAEARRARAEEQAALETAHRTTSEEETRYYPLYLHYPRHAQRPYRGHRPRHHDRRHYAEKKGRYGSRQHRTRQSRPERQR